MPNKPSAKKSEKGKKREKPVSLHPLAFEEAVKGLGKVKPKRKKK